MDEKTTADLQDRARKALALSPKIHESIPSPEGRAGYMAAWALVDGRLNIPSHLTIAEMYELFLSVLAPEVT